MKRKGLAWFLSLVLVFSLFTALAVPANAASYSRSATVGEKVWWTFDVVDIIQAGMGGGALPPGMTIGLNMDCYILHGQPTLAGTYTVTVRCEVQGEDDRYDTVTIVVSDPAAPVVPATPEPTPAPTQPPFAITAHPTRATVTEGGSAVFTANAWNFAWCAWRFISPDGKTEVIFDVTGPHFPGLQVEGGNSLAMKLSSIPIELNGWKAVCLFCDLNNQWHYTDGTAVITVEPAATPTPEPTAPPTPTPEPTQAPAPTPAPTQAPVPVVETEPVATPEPAPEPEAEEKGSALLYILIALALLVLIAGAAMFVMAGKRRNATGTTEAGGWRCSSCGAVNTGNFCSNCGNPRDPDDHS